MFGTDKAPPVAAQAQRELLFNRWRGRDLALTLTFGADLGAVRGPGLTWRLLPGTYDGGTFSGRQEFQYVASQAPASFEFGAHLENRYVGAYGRVVEVDGAVFTNVLPTAATGCAYGILGAWVTEDSAISLFNQFETGTRFYDGSLRKVCNPVEYNGVLFFSARQSTACTPVIGMFQLPIFSQPEDSDIGWDSSQSNLRDGSYLPPVLPSYFSIEGFGENGCVGVMRGKLVVATTRGLWGIVQGDEHQLYFLGQQVAEWNLSPTAKMAVGANHVLGLDGTDLLVYSEASLFVGGSRFTSLAVSNGVVVLGGTSEVAVSHGDGFSTHTGLTAIGALLLDASGNLFTPDRVVRSAAAALTLETTVAEFPGVAALSEVTTGPEVVSVEVTTNVGSADEVVTALQRSAWNETKWAAGVGGRSMRLRFVVASGAAMTVPNVVLQARSKI